MYPLNVSHQQRCNKLYQKVTHSFPQKPGSNTGEGHVLKPVL